MIKRGYFFLVVFTVFQSFFLSGQSRSGVLFDELKLLSRLETLSSDAYEGRKTGEAGSVKSRRFIISQFDTLGVKSLNTSFEQDFSFNIREKKYQGVNVLGTILGTDFPEKYIVISAHYDHLGIENDKIYNGADDNASGVCALFAFAEYFKKNPPKHSIILAAFDAEELGLQGAKFFIKNTTIPKKQIVLNINMDMIGRNIKNELYVVGARYTENLENIIKKFKNPTSIKLLQGHDGSDRRKQNWTMSSDHAPFHKEEIPFLYFGEEDHPDYHQETDDFENIDPVFYNKFLIYTLFR